MVSKFRQWSLYKEGILVLLVMLLVSNLVMFVRLHAIQQRVNRLPTSFPTTVSHAASQSYSGVVSLGYRLLEYRGDVADFVIEFRLTEKLPGYVPIVRYREFRAQDPGPWIEIRPELVDGLQYRALLEELDMTLRYQYDVIQSLEGEIVRQSPAYLLDVAHMIGSSDVHVDFTRAAWTGGEFIRFRFTQNSYAQIQEWQVDSIIVSLDNVAQPYVVRWMTYFEQGSVDIPSTVFDKAEEVTIKVTYSDGDNVTRSFKPVMNPESLVISRR